MRQSIRNSLVAEYRSLLIAAAAFSGVINVLALSGSLYMLQVYDRVIPSKSVPTLLGFTVLLVLLYSAFGALDFCRSRLLSRVGLSLDERIRNKVLKSALRTSITLSRASDPMQAVRDLDSIRTFLSGPAPTALFDLPWMPIYLALAWVLHPVLGMFATAGGVLLVLLTVLTEWQTRAPMLNTTASAAESAAFGRAVLRNSDAAMAMGMIDALVARWRVLSDRQLNDLTTVSDVSGAVSVISKTLRLLLQSGILGLGAYLAILGQLSAGSIIAASIMMSRALAPVEIAIANWRSFTSARQSYARISQLTAAKAAEEKSVALAKASRTLEAAALTVSSPDGARTILKNVTFSLKAGDALGVIGPSAAGKSTLVKALVGLWPLGDDKSFVRLDGAELTQWSAQALGDNIGYLPQASELLQGTIGENISRFDSNATSERVIEAATIAGVHDMIVRLQDGYEMLIGAEGTHLSIGQVQRLALARALYGNPFLVVLDEPNSNLDADGDAALTRAIQAVRRRGGIVVVVAHRPSALNAVNKILVLVDGAVQEIGSREAVLKSLLKRVPLLDPDIADGSRAPNGSESALGYSA